MISKKMMEEITARVAWVLPGAELVPLDNGEYMIRVPMPYGSEHRFWTPEEGSDFWTWGGYSKKPGEELKLTSPLSADDEVRIEGTAEEMAEQICFEYCVSDYTILELEKRWTDWMNCERREGVKRKERPAEAAA